MIKVGQKAKILQDVLSPSSEHVFKAGDIVEFIREENRLGIDFYLFYIPDKSAQYYITKQVFEVFEVPGLDNTIKDTEMKFNLEDHLEEVLEGRLVKLRNGKTASIVTDLRDREGFVGERSLLGYINTEEGRSPVCLWDVLGSISSYETGYDIVGLHEVVTFPEGMWGIIDPLFNYMATDEIGETWFYENEPNLVEGDPGYWDDSSNGEMAENGIIQVQVSNWRQSKIKRSK